MSVKRLSVLLVLFVVVSLAISACGPTPEPETVVETVVVKETVEVVKEATTEVVVTPTAEPAAEEGPKRGGVLKHALPPIQNLDPAFLSTISDGQIARYWTDYFVYIHIVDGNYEPDWDRGLATGYEVNEDATVWTFNVRKGVTFHNGRPLTADDIVFTFDRLRDPEVGGFTVALYSNIEDIEALDDYTVRFTFENPNPDFVIYDLNDYHAHVMDKETEDFETEWNGTGPFIIEEYIPEDRLVMKRNPNYWMMGEDGQPMPYLDGLEFIFLTEPSAQLEALRGGQVHWINWLSPEFVDPLEADPDINVYFQTNNAHYVIHMRADQPPTDDVRVRQAIKAATDHRELLEVVGLGYGSVGRDTPIGPALGDFYLDAPEPVQDVEKAKALLAEAGYADGLEIELIAQDQLIVKGLATVWAEQLAEAGITVNIQVVPVGVYYGEGVWLECQFGITDWGPRTTPQSYLPLAYMCDAAWPESHWCDPELDELAKAAGSELDHDKRVELYHEIQEIFIERGPVVVPYFAQNILAYRDSVKPGLQIDSIATAVELRWVWLEE